MKKHKVLRIMLIGAISIFLLIFICENFDQIVSIFRGRVRDDTISDIAYDANKIFGYTVYIEENGEYAPYLVLTKNYNEDSGNVLLLRKHLVNDDEAYHSMRWYYADSLIDEYLREEFTPILDEKLRNIIVDSEIEIMEAYMSGGMDYIPDIVNGIEKIHRQVFLLSFAEIGFLRSESYGGTTEIEGKPLKYFKKRIWEFNILYFRNKRQVAYRNGLPDWYLLRTPVQSSGGGEGGFCVSQTLEFGTGFGDTTGGCGIRPAFCLPPDTPVKKEVIDGKERYVLVY